MPARVDVRICGGRLITEMGALDAGLAIDGGRIVAIGDPRCLPAAAMEIDATGQLVMPGGIDLHTHIYDPAFPQRGDFSETRAALAGGTTTVAEFVFADEQHDMRQAFAIRKDAAKRLACTDYAFHALLVRPGDLEHIEWLAAAGVLSFKAMMAGVEPMPGMPTDVVREMFRRAAAVGGQASVHAENDEICAALAAEARRQGRNDALAHAHSRPSIVEEEAISRAILLAKEAGLPLHVLHVSTAAGAHQIARARQQGLAVTGETCPHYLEFVDDDLQRWGPFLQVTPTIKGHADRGALWAALEDGTLQCVVSDHFAPLKKEKEPGFDDIWQVEPGVPGIETRVPCLFTRGVLTGRLSIEQFVSAISTQAARIFGLYPRKGVLRVGSDADIVIVDPHREITVEPGHLHQTADWTPFAGLKLAGWPTWVLLRGQIAVREGAVCGAPGSGEYLPRGEQGACHCHSGNLNVHC